MKNAKQKFLYRIIITIYLLILFRVLSLIPVPFVKRDVLSSISSLGIMQMTNIYTGGALAGLTLMATGISSYVTAQILVQLLAYFVPRVHELSKDEAGKRYIKKITIFFGVICSLISSVIVTNIYNNQYNILTNNAWYVFAIIAIIHACGTSVAIWIGETITEKGFSNGCSLLIFVNIVSSFPSMVLNIYNGYLNQTYSIKMISCEIGIFCLIIFAITVVETAKRNIPVQYHCKTSLTQDYIQNQSFPIKLNLAGVMPVVYTSYLLRILLAGCGLIPNDTFKSIFSTYFAYGKYGYIVISYVLVLLVSYVYSFLVVNTRDIAKNMQTGGCIIDGLMPGKPTADYLRNVVKNLSLYSAFFMATIVAIPQLFTLYTGMSVLQSTSIVIMVGVAISLCHEFRIERKSLKIKL